MGEIFAGEIFAGEIFVDWKQFIINIPARNIFRVFFQVGGGGGEGVNIRGLDCNYRYQIH